MRTNDDKRRDGRLDETVGNPQFDLNSHVSLPAQTRETGPSPEKFLHLVFLDMPPRPGTHPALQITRFRPRPVATPATSDARSLRPQSRPPAPAASAPSLHSIRRCPPARPAPRSSSRFQGIPHAPALQSPPSDKPPWPLASLSTSVPRGSLRLPITPLFCPRRSVSASRIMHPISLISVPLQETDHINASVTTPARYTPQRLPDLSPRRIYRNPPSACLVTFSFLAAE